MAEDIVEARLNSKVKSFKTSRGSLYSYDDEGKTIRFKTKTGEQFKRQDLTIFVDLTLDEEQEVLHSIQKPHEQDNEIKAYCVERLENDQPKIVRDRGEIINVGRLYFGVLRKDGSWQLMKKASLVPSVGKTVFDTRHYTE